MYVYIYRERERARGLKANIRWLRLSHIHMHALCMIYQQSIPLVKHISMES